MYVGALPDQVEVARVGPLVEAAGAGEARQPAVAVHLQVGPDQSQLSIEFRWSNHRSVLGSDGPITGQYYLPPMLRISSVLTHSFRCG